MFGLSSPGLHRRAMGFAKSRLIRLDTNIAHGGQKSKSAIFGPKKKNLSCTQQWQPDVNDELVRQGCGFVRADGCGDCGPDRLPQGRLQPPHVFFFF